MDPSDRQPAERLERAECDLDKLLELSESLTASSAIEGTLFSISGLISDVLDSDRCSIIVLDDDHRAGYIVASSDDPTVTHLSIDLEDYPEIRETIRMYAPLIVDDVHRAPIFDSVRDKIAGKPVGSTVLFPVVLDRRVQAVLHLRTEQTRERRLTRSEIRFGRIVANVAGIALRNARLYETVRDRSERRLSDRIRAERRLRQIEKYQRFFDFAGDGLMIVDGSARILFANRAAQAILGFGADDMSRIRLGDIVQDDSREDLDAILLAIFDGRYVRDQDLAVLKADGETAVLSMTCAPLADAAGEEDLPELVERERSPSSTGGNRKTATAIVSFRDVTTTRSMEDELRRTKDFLTNLINSSADAIVAADMAGNIILFNPTAEIITGWSSDEILGTDVARMYPQGVARQILAELRSEEFGGPGKLQERREHLMTKGGDVVPVNLAAAIVYDQGEEVATVGIFADLRERLDLEAQLEKAQQKLELSERQSAVMELAGAAAHELNQPLTSIIGTVELMMRKVAPESVAAPYLETLLAESDRMAESVRRLGQLTRYKRIPYVGDTDILDLGATVEED